MLLFDLNTAPDFGRALAAALGVEIAPHEARRFEDGESKLRPLADPQAEDVYVLHSLHGDVQHSPHDKLVSLLMFVATLRDHGARRVSAVVPYLAYGRKDRRTQAFDPVGSRYVAQLLEAVGLGQLIVLEAHNPAALDNAFRCPVRHLHAHPAFDGVAQASRQRPLVVASPDPGGVKRAQLWREHLEAAHRQPVGFAMIDKRRLEGTVSGFDLVAGEVAGADVLLLDDLIATGHTLVRAARALRNAGARSVVCCAAHGLFFGDADQLLCDAAIDRVVVCDSVPPLRVAPGSPLRQRLGVVSCVPMFAAAIRDSQALGH